MKNFLLVFFVVITIPSSAGAKEKTITVDAKKVLNSGTTHGARLGINVNHLWDDQANRKPDSPTFAEVLQKFKVKFLRYPNGEDSDNHLWSTPPYDRPNPRPARISMFDWPSNQPQYWVPVGSLSGNWAHPIYDFDEFMADCRVIQCEPVIVVAYDGAYKPAHPGGASLTLETAIEAAVAWVRYANVVKGYGIKYWEIGNETWIDSYAGADPGRNKQARDLVEFSRAMKKIDPTIKIGANGNTKKDFKTLLSEAATEIDFLSVHSYPAQEIRNYKQYKKSTLNPLKVVDSAYDALQKFSAHRNRIKILMTETGGQVSPGRKGAWPACDTGHSLMTFEILARLMEDHRVLSSIFWNSRWDPGNYCENDALHFPENSYTAQGWALHILGNFLLDRMISATDAGDVLAFATHDPQSNKMNVFLMNKETSSVNTAVQFNQFTPKETSNLWIFAGENSNDTRPKFYLDGKVRLQNGRFTFELKPVSISILEIL